MKRIKIDLNSPSKEAIYETSRCLKDDGIIIYPTETLYGIGVNALKKELIEKVLKIKKRDQQKPIALIIKDDKMLKKIVSFIPPLAYSLIKKYWPGPLTIIFNASPLLPDNLFGNKGRKIGVRISSSIFVRKLFEFIDFPITATSANISGENNNLTPTDIISNFSSNIDIFIDGGKLKNVEPSTVIDITDGKIKIIRKGVIDLGKEL
ncbi:MAG: threonylcarbamoyl-AMP synthase [Deltaproteobacteria bacterium]|nr:MAG: threonylcarbamoyl-AMP synthase [Deltaproteobacteria bacterium]